MILNEKLLQRANQLIEKANNVKSTTIQQNWGSSVDQTKYTEWKNNSENFIEVVSGNQSAFYKNFIKLVTSNEPHYVETGLGILIALKEDMELGFLTSVHDLAVSEVFSDFLDIAEHLLKNGYKDPAASLIGATLEDGLRKICVKNNIKFNSGSDISSLNTIIADKEIYNRLIQKQIQAWKSIRDSADHGKFDEYKIDDVKDMCKGVERFLTGNM